jgi:hypothetical protein
LLHPALVLPLQLFELLLVRRFEVEDQSLLGLVQPLPRAVFEVAHRLMVFVLQLRVFGAQFAELNFLELDLLRVDGLVLLETDPAQLELVRLLLHLDLNCPRPLLLLVQREQQILFLIDIFDHEAVAFEGA